MKGIRIIGVALVALLAVGVIASGQQVGLWSSTATGIQTGGTVSVTGAITTNGGITMSQNGPVLVMKSTGAAVDAGLWYFQALNPGFRFGAAEDDFGGQNDVFVVSRSGSTATLFTLGVPLSSTAQPGFLVYNTNDDTFFSSGTIDLDGEIYDIANNFAADTFTASVGGAYDLCGTVRATNTANTIFQLRLLTSNRGYTLEDLQSIGNISNSLSGCVHADMDAGDTAVLNLTTNDNDTTIAGVSGSTYQTFFSGRLVP